MLKLHTPPTDIWAPNMEARAREAAYEQHIDNLLRASAEGVAAMREEAERIIANSRRSIRPRLRKLLDELQADYDYVGSKQSHEWGE